MIHTITVEASILAETLKAAQNYVGKSYGDEPMNYILITLQPKEKKLAVISCDGHGYFERKLPLLPQGKGSKTSLPGNIFISSSDAATLLKFLPAKLTDTASITIDDKNEKSGHYIAQVSLASGAMAAVPCRNDLEMPDYGTIKKRAEKGRKTPLQLNNVNIPVHEMIRAGKVFTNKAGGFARLFTSIGKQNGIMAMLESCDPEMEAKVIFMLANPVDEAA